MSLKDQVDGVRIDAEASIIEILEDFVEKTGFIPSLIDIARISSVNNRYKITDVRIHYSD